MVEDAKRIAPAQIPQVNRPGQAAAGAAVLARDGMRARRFPGLRNIFALILREISTSGSATPGGYLWKIVDPIAGITIMVLLFSLMFRSPPIGNSFPLFYASGYLPFVIYNTTANLTATSINFSRPLLNYPVVSFLDAMLARFILNYLTEIVVASVIFSGIILLFGARADVDLNRLILASAMLAVLGAGVGTLNCYLMTAYPLWERTWQIVTRPMFLISGIFFIFTDLPKWVQEILWWNPVIHCVGMVRAGFYGFYRDDYISPAYVFGVGLTLLSLGLLLLWRHYRILLNG